MRLESLTLILFLLASVCTVFAQSPTFSATLTDPLPQRDDVTYADLVRLLVPGFGAGGEAQSWNTAIEIRHIAGWDQHGVEPKAGNYLHIVAVPVRSDGRDRLALLLDFGDAEYTAEGVAVLALYDVAGEPRLLDAANVAFDRNTFFPDPARLRAGTDNDLLIIRSTHHNSSQRYVKTALMLVRHDRLELVDTISNLNVRYCAYEWIQQLDVRQGAGEPFADVTATVTELTTPSEENCGDAAVPEPRTHTITVIYHWDADAQRYVPNSDAFVILARENEKRF